MSERTPTKDGSVLRECPVWPDLQAACAIVLNTPHNIVQSITVSVPVYEIGATVDSAITRYVEEQCLVARLHRTDTRLVVRVTRRSDASGS